MKIWNDGRHVYMDFEEPEAVEEEIAELVNYCVDRGITLTGKSDYHATEDATRYEIRSMS